MNEIIFMIEDDPDGGYNAQALGYSIFTQGETVEELKENIMDAFEREVDGGGRGRMLAVEMSFRRKRMCEMWDLC
jgi:hypothetical protein